MIELIVPKVSRNIKLKVKTEIENTPAENLFFGKGVIFFMQKENEIELPSEKARYWCAVLYPENMIDDWQNQIGDKLQMPFCYCVHDSDVDKAGEHRKTHVHVMICYTNTVRASAVYKVFDRLSKTGYRCLSTIEPVNNVRHMYEYLIHNTESARKQKKFQYDKAQRICGNNFDIGSFEQISVAEKSQMCKEICQFIIDNGFINFTDFYEAFLLKFDSGYFSIIQTYSGLFERLCKGNWQRQAKKR